MSLIEPKSSSNQPFLAILMATYNGELFLSEQLQSMVDQVMPNWALFVSDDGSSDKTKDLLDKFASTYSEKQVHILNGPRKGFAKNFLSLVCNSDIHADFFAYADQDDVWVSDKLVRAIEWLETVPTETPALYCSRTDYVDQDLQHIAFSPEYDREPNFSNALVQNIASGNTMVFNQATRKLLQEAGKDIDIPLHDWWTYMLVTGAGGVVHFDRTPTLLYRQHDGNLWGMNAGWRARFSRIKKLFEGRFRGWNERHVAALMAVSNCLTAEARQKLNFFAACRNGSGLFQRLMYLRKSRVYRQTTLANLGLLTAVLFRKI
jgi:glycosyltransferase involved in cell wall biosynthesis